MFSEATLLSVTSSRASVTVKQDTAAVSATNAKPTIGATRASSVIAAIAQCQDRLPLNAIEGKTCCSYRTVRVLTPLNN